MSNQKQVALRISADYHSKIHQVAVEKKRSIHSQILFMLDTYFDKELLRQRLQELERASP